MRARSSLAAVAAPGLCPELKPPRRPRAPPRRRRRETRPAVWRARVGPPATPHLAVRPPQPPRRQLRPALRPPLALRRARSSDGSKKRANKPRKHALRHLANEPSRRRRRPHLKSSARGFTSETVKAGSKNGSRMTPGRCLGGHGRRKALKAPVASDMHVQQAAGAGPLLARTPRSRSPAARPASRRSRSPGSRSKARRCS